jgi:hypothetical protein
MPQIEQADRDDLMLEVFAQLGEMYLTRSALDGARECIRRIEDCLAVYAAILAGQRPELADQVTMSGRDITRMICRYSRRAKFLETGLRAAQGDHEAAESALTALAGHCGDAEVSDLADEHG